MSEKLNHSDLSALLAKEAEISIAKAETFTKAMFDLIIEGLEQDGIVKINGLGTFKILEVADRYSVNVNTGDYNDLINKPSMEEIQGEALDAKADIAPVKIGTDITVTDSRKASVHGFKLYGRTIIEGKGTDEKPYVFKHAAHDGWIMPFKVSQGNVIPFKNTNNELQFDITGIGNFNYTNDDFGYGNTAHAKVAFEVDYKINLDDCYNCKPNVFVVRGQKFSINYPNNYWEGCSVLNVKLFVYRDKITFGTYDKTGENPTDFVCEQNKTYHVKAIIDTGTWQYDLYVDEEHIQSGLCRDSAKYLTGFRLTMQRDEGDWGVPQMFFSNMNLSQAKNNYLIRDIFSGNLGNWGTTSVSGGNQSNYSISNYNNDKLRIALNAGRTTDVSSKRDGKIDTSKGLTTVEFEISGSEDLSTTYESCLLLKNSSNATVVNIGFKGGRVFLNGSAKANVSLTSTHHVRVATLNSTQQVWLSIDGNLVGEGYYNSNYTSWEGIWLMAKNNTSSNQMYTDFDEVYVYQYSEQFTDMGGPGLFASNYWTISNNVKNTNTNLRVPHRLAGIQADYIGSHTKNKTTYQDEDGKYWICDEADYFRKKVIRRIGNYTVSVSNDYISKPYAPYYGENVFDITNEVPLNIDLESPLIICNQYKYKGLVVDRSCENESKALKDGEFLCQVSSNMSYQYFYVKDTRFSTKEEFVAHLTKQPLSFACVLKNPIESEIDWSDGPFTIPSTYDYATNFNVNNVNSTRLSPILEVQYLARTTALQPTYKDNDIGKVLTIDKNGNIIPGDIGYGFGQNKGKVITSQKELDNTLENGWYYADFVYLTINGYYDLQGVPIFVCNGWQFFNIDLYGVRTFAYRYRGYSKTWSEWIWLNAPDSMHQLGASSVGLSNWEIPIAEQYKDKQVYTRTYYFGEIPTSGIRTVSFGQYFKPTQIIRCSGHLDSGDCLPFYGDGEVVAVVSASTSGITIKTNGMQSGLKAYVQIWYTKEAIS